MVGLIEVKKCFLSIAIFLCSINAEGNNNRFIFEKNKPNDFSCRIENEHGLLRVIIQDGFNKFDFEKPNLKANQYFSPSVVISFNGPFIGNAETKQDSISFSLGYKSGQSIEDYLNLSDPSEERIVSLQESLSFVGDLYLFTDISSEIHDFDLVKGDFFVRTDNGDLAFEISTKLTNLYFLKKPPKEAYVMLFTDLTPLTCLARLESKK